MTDIVEEIDKGIKTFAGNMAMIKPKHRQNERENLSEKMMDLKTAFQLKLH